MTEFSVRIGGVAAVRPRWWGKAWSIIYAGMVGEETSSVAVMWTMGYNSAAYNLYLSLDQREFELPIGRVTVSDVSPGELRFRFLARSRG